MGLYAKVEFDFPTETPVVGIPIDYSEALDEFCKTFDQVSYKLCPVDTGYLRSTLSSEHDGELTVECWADAEYAQYQEYGTWCMNAQPYFEPAIRQATQVVLPIMKELLEEALEEEQAELARQAQANSSAADGTSGGIGFFDMILLSLFMGLIQGIINVVKKLLSGDDTTPHGSGSGGVYFDIDIT